MIKTISRFIQSSQWQNHKRTERRKGKRPELLGLAALYQLNQLRALIEYIAVMWVAFLFLATNVHRLTLKTLN